MPKRLNPNLAKIHRNYTVEDVSELFGVHKGTVRIWIKSGLPVCDEQRPMLILGYELRDYLQSKRQVRKRKCRLFEIYCLRCRVPKRPAGNMVDFEPQSEVSGRLIGLCPDCDGLINRYTSLAGLGQIREHLEVRIPKALKHINKCSNALVNSDFNKGA
tara:strand:- start:2560 stop:3036 length:477 start_codon:yes stop_codon:yes gene_type:complete